MQRSKWFGILILVMLLAASVMPLVPAAAQEDMAQRNKAAVQDALAKLNAGDVDGFYELYADPYQMNEGDAILHEATVADTRFFVEALYAAIPDLVITSEVIIAQGDWVATELSFSGTYTEPFTMFGLEPTGQSVYWTEMDFFHFNADGKLDINWAVSDPMIMLGQLGMFPPEEPEDDASDVILDVPAGYQLLSADELETTLSSGMEERNVGLFTGQLALGIDSSSYFTDTFISWKIGTPVLHTTSVQVEEDIAFTSMIAAAMPDHVVSTDIVVAEGDWVAALVTVRGTFTADTNFFGTPLAPTDQEIVWQLGMVDRFNADGKIIEEWVETDTTPLFVGLGLMSSDEGE
jgi:predicted ester cyclase